MDYITIREAVEKWGLKVRRVQVMWQENKIPGAFRFGRAWAINEVSVPLKKAQNERQEKLRTIRDGFRHLWYIIRA